MIENLTETLNVAFAQLLSEAIKFEDGMFNTHKLVISDIEMPSPDRIYITINNHFDLRIVKTDEGIVLDIFSSESIGDPLATTYAFDQEALDEIEENENE